jgi:hypothetical protein
MIGIVRLKETLKERELREKLEKDLQTKEKYLQETVSKQSELEQKLFNLNMAEYKQKQENERLLKVFDFFVLLIYFVFMICCI